jgi:neutral trehalase
MSKDLQQNAKEILNKNAQSGKFTIPCYGLYPFQWNWDSGFIAIGFAHYNMKKAEEELSTLLDAQWANGFIPHIVFHNDSDSYFPGPDFHQSSLHPQASKNYKSTGMTQPPVLGFVLQELYKISKTKSETLEFIKSQIDKVFNNHTYYYKHRDPKNEGLVYIYHNWESGTDNSPIWDRIWEEIDAPEYTFERRDTSHVDSEQRPSNKEYNHYLHIIEVAKAHNYNDEKIAELSPFLVQDPLFNAMLIKSNQSLIELYEILGQEDTKIKQLKVWQEKSIKQFNNKLFDEKLGAYIHYDLRNNKPIPMITSSSFTPLFANIPSKAQAETLVNTLMKKFGREDYYLCASFDPDHKLFNPKKYWRGPVWINLNWLVIKGLRNYNFDNYANRVKKETIELISKNGFYEYFDPRKQVHKEGKGGYGGNNFSWTAALLLDLLNEN